MTIDQDRNKHVKTHSGLKARTLNPLTSMYERPFLDWREDGRCSMIDTDGRVMLLQAAFMNHLFRLYAKKSYQSMCRMLLDLTRIMRAYDQGKGLELHNLDDAFLVDRLRPEFLVYRGVKVSTLRRNMRVLFRCLQFGERNGFFSGVIGSEHDDARFRVNLPGGAFKNHPVMSGIEPRIVPAIPTHLDLDIVEAETMSLIKRPSIKRRLQLMTRTARPLGFRRSELANLTASLIPSKHDLVKLRAGAEAGQRAWTVPIPVARAKGGGTRVAHFHIGLLEELREFIDTDRKEHLKPGVNTDAIFVSTKTGDALEPSYFTNTLKLGARKAAAHHSRQFGDIDLRKVHPHHYRHRAATDMLIGFLRSGMKPLEAVLTVMDALGIKRFSTISIYLSLAQAELNGTHASPSTTNRTPSDEVFDQTEHDLLLLHELAQSGDNKRRGTRL
jgi:integrase